MTEEEKLELVRLAIESQATLEFEYGGMPRGVQPTAVDGGVVTGRQVSGSTRGDRELPCWFRARLGEIDTLRIA